MSPSFPTSRIAPFAILGVLILLAVLAATTLLSERSYDPRTLCPRDGDYGRTAILIDATDSLGASQVKVIVEEINKLMQHLDMYEWIGLFILNEDNITLAKPEIERCNPGSEANPITENPKLIQQKFQREFQEPMEKAVRQLVRRPTQATSPIFEMIYAISQDRNFDSTKKRGLVIVSDMLQNVSKYSHYDGYLNTADPGEYFENWKNTDYARQVLQLSLHGVEVHILYVQRPDSRRLQTRGHVRFWENYFSEVGAKIVRLTPVR